VLSLIILSTQFKIISNLWITIPPAVRLHGIILAVYFIYCHAFWSYGQYALFKPSVEDATVSELLENIKLYLVR